MFETLVFARAVLTSAWHEQGEDNIGLIAAGVAFYAFLALVPVLGAIVLSYGLVATPTTVVENFRTMTSVLPADAARLIGEQLLNVVRASADKKGIGLLIALGVALFGARNGALAIITALNVAYEVPEKRGFIRLNLLALAMTIASVVAAMVGTVGVAALGQLDSLLAGAPGAVVLGKIASLVVLLAVGAAGAAALYRYAPCRNDPRWAWITPGSIFAAVAWGLLTLGFGAYVSSFGNYNATYGSLGAVVVLLTWIWLTAYALLLGGEINSEIEKRRAQADQMPRVS